MREKLYEIKAEAQQRARFVGTRPLLVVLERDFTSKPKWFDETVRLYDGRTGDFKRRVNVAPKHDFAALDTVPTP